MSQSLPETWLIFAALSVLPLFLMTTTSFVKISVVFSILRNALGVGDVPSGLIVVALSVLLTSYVMAPVASEVMANVAPSLEKLESNAGKPLTLKTLWQLVEQGKEPIRKFLLRNTNARDRKLFSELAQRGATVANPQLDPTAFRVLMPSFLATELTEAFKIGFLVFLPFLILDLIIAMILTSVGLTMVSPVAVGLPFKLLFFVAADGWYLLSRALVLGYN